MTLKRIIYKIFYPLAKLYWFVVRPKSRGVKCLIEWQDKFLMIRNTYGEGFWTFPGGGVKKGETAESAVKREIKEEVGISLNELVKLGEFTIPWESRIDTVSCFWSGVLSPEFIIDKDEILEARWISLKDVPAHRSATADTVIAMYRKQRENI